MRKYLICIITLFSITVLSAQQLAQQTAQIDPITHLLTRLEVAVEAQNWIVVAVLLLLSMLGLYFSVKGKFSLISMVKSIIKKPFKKNPKKEPAK